MQTFLRKFNRFFFLKTLKVLLLVWVRFFKIKDAFGNKQYKPEDVKELIRKLFNDVQNIHEELAEYINTLSWNRPACYNYNDDDEDYTIAITPILSTEEPVDSLIMKDEHLDTILATESNEVIKSSVKDLVPILSESEGILNNMCDVPFHDNSLPLDISKDQFEDFFDSNDDSTSIDDDYFFIDDIVYVEASPPDFELVSLEEVKDDILCEKLLNIHLLIDKIESLNVNPTPDCVLKSPSPFPIPVEDNDSLFEKTSSSYANVLTTHPTLMLDSDFIPSDNSLPESEIFCFDIEEKNSGSTTIYADISLLDFNHFHFKSEPDLGDLTSIIDLGIHENVSPMTNVNLPFEDDQSPLFAYVEVILNDDSPAPTRVVDGVLQLVAPTTAEHRLARKNELKARGTLLMALPDKHQLKFNTHKDTKTLMEAIEKSTNEPVSATASVSAVSEKIHVSAIPNIDADDLEEIDLKWQMAMLTVRGHFTRECRSPKDTRRNGAAEPQRRNVLVETSTSNALVSQCDGVGSYDLSFQAEEESTNYALMAFSSSSSSSNNELRDNALVSLRQNLEKAKQERDDLKLKLEKFKTSSKNLSELLASQTNDKIGTFMPSKPDLVFNNAPNDVETDHPAFTVKLSPTRPDQDISYTHRTSAPIIEDWVFDSKDDSETKTPHNVPSFVQPTKQKMAQPTARNHAKRGTHKQYAQMSLPNPQRHVVPATILTQSKLVPITAARLVSTAVPKISVTRPRQAKTVVTKTNSRPIRHIIHSPPPKASNFPSKVTVVKAPRFNATQVVKGKWEWKPKCPVLDHVSRNTSASMTLKRFDYNDALRRSKSVMAWVPKRN
uniref:Uncharacterized protein n=1 Tax=Tanacetum cinerariifolium TaxID=118510 RepID=A0A6L2K629_TANCI|nr:hypothetical protein [Tanacetum cinerariifolium]